MKSHQLSLSGSECLHSASTSLLLNLSMNMPQRIASCDDCTALSDFETSLTQPDKTLAIVSGEFDDFDYCPLNDRLCSVILRSVLLILTRNCVDIEALNGYFNFSRPQIRNP